MSFLSTLFPKKNKVIEPISMHAVGMDMHSHLIPGLDDGAPNIETSIELILKLKEFGYHSIITTPHIYKEIYPNTAEIILEGKKKVLEELALRNIDIRFDAAAEYFCDEHFIDLLNNKQLLTFNGNHVLFELSFDSEPYYYKDAVFQMQLNGYQPVLAHPERYVYWHEKMTNYENAFDRDVFLQVNINSFTGQYGPGVKKMAERLVDAGLISYLGTDTHHIGHVNLWETASRNPFLKKLVESGNLLNQQY
jgi:tyrosine-protein phosphatase YwqE